MQALLFDKSMPVSEIQQLSNNTLSDHLGIEFMEIGDNYLIARMPVDHRTVQPMGLLHGGASVVLAETLGSIASSMIVDLDKQYCVGLEINANHIKSARQGFVTAKATPIHVGGKTHIWEIRIVNENEDLVCISRLTVAVLDIRK